MTATLLKIDVPNRSDNRPPVPICLINYTPDFIGNKAAKMASKPYAAGISSIFKVIAETLAYQAFHYFR